MIIEKLNRKIYTEPDQNGLDPVDLDQTYSDVLPDTISIRVYLGKPRNGQKKQIYCKLDVSHQTSKETSLV